MNIYDTKSIQCAKCKVSIGEIEFDATVTMPLCGHCANPLPAGDNIIYTISHIQNSNMQKLILKSPANNKHNK